MKLFSLFLILILSNFRVNAQDHFPRFGEASYYGDFVNYHRVACGERYCKDSFTAAHRTLPFGTYVKVTNLKNNKSVVVRITDRGPRKRSRIIDLSGAAARQLDMIKEGVVRVKIELASADDIMNQRKAISDSAINDTLSAKSTEKNPKDSVFLEKYMIQGGAYRTLNSAGQIKNYLQGEGVQHVKIRKSRWRRRIIYKVMIGPVDVFEKDNILCLLKNKGLSAFVMRL